MMRFANSKSKYRISCYLLFTVYCIVIVVNAIHSQSSDAIDKKEMGIYDNGANGSNHEQQHAIHFAESHEQFEMLLREAGIEEESSAYRKSWGESQHLEEEKIRDGVSELVGVDEDFEKLIRDAKSFQENTTTMNTVLHQDSKIIQPSRERQTSPTPRNSTSTSAKGFLRSTASVAADQSNGACAGLFAIALVATIFTIFVGKRKLFNKRRREWNRWV